MLKTVSNSIWWSFYPESRYKTKKVFFFNLYELTVEQLAGSDLKKTKKFSLYETIKKGLYKPIYKMTYKLWFG